MPRIRSIKPEFWGDRKLARLVSRDARLLYVALWNHADEHSRVQGDPRYVKGHCLPYDDDLDENAVDALVNELVTAGRVVRYEVEGDPYLHLPKLAAHQRLEPAKVASRLPEPPAHTDSDLDPSRAQIFSDNPAPRTDGTGKSVALPVAGSMGQVAGCREPVARTAPDDPTGVLLAEHADGYTQPLPPSALSKFKVEIMRLVAEGVEPDRIRAGLTKIRTRNLAASLLPQLVTEAKPGAVRSTADDRVSGTLAMAERFAATEGVTPKGITA